MIARIPRLGFIVIVLTVGCASSTHAPTTAHEREFNELVSKKMALVTSEEQTEIEMREILADFDDLRRQEEADLLRVQKASRTPRREQVELVKYVKDRYGERGDLESVLQSWLHSQSMRLIYRYTAIIEVRVVKFGLDKEKNGKPVSVAYPEFSDADHETERVRDEIWAETAHLTVP